MPVSLLVRAASCHSAKALAPRCSARSERWLRASRAAWAQLKPTGAAVSCTRGFPPGVFMQASAALRPLHWPCPAMPHVSCSEASRKSNAARHTADAELRGAVPSSVCPQAGPSQTQRYQAGHAVRCACRKKPQSMATANTSSDVVRPCVSVGACAGCRLASTSSKH
jgi:hypothetical protein